MSRTAAAEVAEPPLALGAPLPVPGPIPAWPWLRTVLLGWLWLALLAAGSHVLTRMPPWGWLLTVLLLAALPAWGLWLAMMLRKKLQRFQFSPQGHIGRWLSGGWLPAYKALVLALLLCSASLWQAWFLARWEWGLLACAPPLYAALAWWMQVRLQGEFSTTAFAWAWAQRVAKSLVVVLLGAAWLYGMARSQGFGRALSQGMDPAVLDATLAQIRSSPSGLVRWGLDSLLSLQLAGAVVTDLPQWPALRWLLLALFGPVGVLLCLGSVMQGACGGKTVWRHAVPPGAGSRATPLLSLMAVLVLGILLQTTASVDGLARMHESPLALQRLPQCERIGEQFYTVGTLAQTRQQAMQVLGQVQAEPQLCQGMSDVQLGLNQAVEDYLDWYFSLGAEWGRIFSLLTGDVGQFLQNKLTQTWGATPGLEAWMQLMQEQTQRSGAALTEGQKRVQETLARHHLAVNASQCLVREQVAQLPALDLLGDARQRLAASAAVGTGAGAFAAMVAGKAMAKASMKAAGKVLAKAAAKQGLGKAGAAVAGAAVGSVVPGIGTVAGAVAGAIAGAVIGVGIDWAALYAEELLTRDAMRADLRAALTQQLESLGKAIGCSKSGD